MSPAAPFVAPEPRALVPFFPNYEIEVLIACGGMGAVYRARQTALEREVAIKILPKELSSDKEFRDNFSAEAKAMAKLNHPNLIGVYDFGEADGMLFIIMEYVPGLSLHQLAAGKPVEIQGVAELVSQICAGLAHAHQHGILHRDIKPANILLDLQSHPKIGDFGLARPIGFAARDDETIFGTPHYTAPEVVENPSAVDARADIFSLGVVMHELLTGKLPAHDKRPPSAISGCPAGFDAIVQRATNPNPALRYPDAAAMGREVGELARALRRPPGPAIGRPAPKGPGVRRPVAGRAPGPAPVAISTATARRPVGATMPASTGKGTARMTRATPRPAAKSSGNGTGGIWLLGGLFVIGVITYLFFQSPAAPVPKPQPKPIDSFSRPPGNSGNKPILEAARPRVPVGTDEPSRPLPETRPDASGTASIGNQEPPNKEENPWGRTLQPDQSAGATGRESAAANSGQTIPTSGFDVEGFLDRARSVMRDKASPFMVARDAALEKNLEAFARKVNRKIRDLENRETRKAVEERLQRQLDKIKAGDRHLPTLNESGLGGVAGATAVYEASMKEQENIDSTFQDKLKELEGLYIKGIELQIGRMNATTEAAAIAKLQAEITATRESPRHFHGFIEDLPQLPGDDNANVNKLKPVE